MNNVLTPVFTSSQCLCLLRSLTHGGAGGLYPKTNFNLILFEVLATSNNADHSSPKVLSFLCFQDSTTSSVPSSHCLSRSSLWSSLPMSSLLITVSQVSALFPLPLGDPTLQPFIFNYQVYTLQLSDLHFLLLLDFKHT